MKIAVLVMFATLIAIGMAFGTYFAVSAFPT